MDEKPKRNLWISGKRFDSFADGIEWLREQQRERQKVEAMNRLAAALENNGRLPEQAAQESQEESPKPQLIPTITKTKRERDVFGKALEKEYMSLEGNGYRWNKSKSLLAYLCGRLYCGDRVREDDFGDILKKGTAQMQAKAVKELFNGVDVASSRYTLKTPPRNYWLIDELFKEASK